MFFVLKLLMDFEIVHVWNCSQ